MSNDESGGRTDNAPAAHSPALNPRDRHDAEARTHVRALHRRSEAARRLPAFRAGRPGLYRHDPLIPDDEPTMRPWSPVPVAEQARRLRESGWHEWEIRRVLRLPEFELRAS